ncbi:MAG: hypothetical protein HYY84_19485 [Deltaproteobacteria bacterium]|nr:hypothetical protein [Deltaproteobacteria bacterium]
MAKRDLRFACFIGVALIATAATEACSSKSSTPTDGGVVITPFDAGGGGGADAGGNAGNDAGLGGSDAGTDAGGSVVSTLCDPDGGGGETEAECDIVGIGPIGFCGICGSYPDGGFLQINGQAAGVGYNVPKNPAIAIWCAPGYGLQAQNCYPSAACGFIDHDAGFFCVPGACSASVPSGSCDAGSVCFDGGCAPPPACSASAPTGTCDAGQYCVDAGCSNPNLCGSCTKDSDCIGTVAPYTPGAVYCRPLVDAGTQTFVTGNCSDGGTCFCLQDCDGFNCPANYMCNGDPNVDCIPTNMNCPATADAG